MMKRKNSSGKFPKIFLAAFVLIGAAVFASGAFSGKEAADNPAPEFAKAPASISGTIILHDSDVPVKMTALSLPGSSCTASISACGTSAAPTYMSFTTDTYIATTGNTGTSCGYELIPGVGYTYYYCKSSDDYCIDYNNKLCSNAIKLSDLQPTGYSSSYCGYNNSISKNNGAIYFQTGVKYIAVSYSCS